MPIDGIAVAQLPGAQPTNQYRGQGTKPPAVASPGVVLEATEAAATKVRRASRAAVAAAGGQQQAAVASSGAGGGTEMQASPSPGAAIAEVSGSICVAMKELATICDELEHAASGQPVASPSPGDVERRMQEACRELDAFVSNEAAPEWARFGAGNVLGALRQAASMLVAHAAMKALTMRYPDGAFAYQGQKVAAAAITKPSVGTLRASAATGGPPAFKPGPRLDSALCTPWLRAMGWMGAGGTARRRPPEAGSLLLLTVGLRPFEKDASPAPRLPADYRAEFAGRERGRTAREEEEERGLVVRRSGPEDDGSATIATLDAATKARAAERTEVAEQITAIASRTSRDERLRGMLGRLGKLGTTEPLYVSLMTCPPSRPLQMAAQSALREACFSRGLIAVAGLLEAGAHADAAASAASMDACRPIQAAASMYDHDPEGALDKLLLLLMRGALLRGSFDAVQRPRAHINRHRILVAAAAARGLTSTIVEDPLAVIPVLPGDGELGISALEESPEQRTTVKNTQLLAHLQHGADELMAGAGIDLEGVMADLPSMLEHV